MSRAWLRRMTSPFAPPPREPAIDPTGLVIGVAVGIPAAVGTGAVLALARGVFDQTNAALILMIVVVAVAALGGRAAGVITALAAVVSFDFFHTQPYLSLTIDSRDDIETTILLLIAGVIVGTLASSGRRARSRATRRPLGDQADPPCRRGRRIGRRRRHRHRDRPGRAPRPARRCTRAGSRRSPSTTTPAVHGSGATARSSSSR